MNLICTIGVFLIFSSLKVVLGDAISCVDRTGTKVDWSLTYKLPKVKTSSDPKYRRGAGHIESTPSDSQWTTVDEGIDDAKSIIGKTLAPLFLNDSGTAYVLYNDQPPNGPTVFNNGHTKGVILANAHGGIWVVHSVPHFPSVDSKQYTYPRTGYVNGQMFLCLTLTVSQVDGIAQVLTYTRPNFYNYSIPKALVPVLPNLSKLLTPPRITERRSGPWFKLVEMDVANLNFLVFAKGPKFHSEIYSDWIAPTTNSSLNVQSWLNGLHPFPSNCTSSNLAVHNILVKDLDRQDFSSHSDHSKWAVGASASIPWACVGDLNRMQHQKRRGGAVLCTRNGHLWNLLANSITDIQPCPKKRHTHMSMTTVFFEDLDNAKALVSQATVFITKSLLTFSSTTSIFDALKERHQFPW